jgi:PAS domain S-box-containing protein
MGDVLDLRQERDSIEYAPRSIDSIQMMEEALRERAWDLILYDFDISALAPAYALNIAHTIRPQTPLIFIADRATVHDAVDMMRLGARGFVEKGDRQRLSHLFSQELGIRRSATKQVMDTPVHPTIAQGDLNEILDTMQDAIMSVSLIDRRLLFASASFETVFGYPVQQFLEDPDFFKQVVYPNDLPLAMAAQERCIREGFTEFDHRILWPDGQVRWLHRRAWINYDAQGRPVRVNDSARDITAQKEAEEALRASEEKFRSLIESSDSVIAMLDGDGTYLYFNDVAARTLGMPAELLVGKSLYDLFPIEADSMLAAVRQVLTSGAGMVIETTQTIAGEQHWFRTSLQPIRNHEGTPYAVLIQANDITANKFVEQELLAQNEILQQSHDLISMADLNGGITFINRAGARLLGDDQPEFFVGKHISDLHLPQDTERILNNYLPQALRTGYWHGENRLKRVDGDLIDVDQTIFPIVDESGTMISVATIMVDIRERIAAQRALQEAHDLLEQRVFERTAELEQAKDRIEAIFNHSGDGILLLDIKRGIQRANYTFDTLFNIRINDYLDTKLSMWVHPDETTAIDAIIEEIAQTHQMQQIESKARRADGTEFDVEINIAPVNRTNLRVTNLVCIIRDITARKAAQEALRLGAARNRALIEANPDLMFIFNRDGIYLDAKDSELLVMRLEELLGLSVLDMFPDERGEYFLSVIRQVIDTGEAALLEYDLPTPHGQVSYEARIVKVNEDEALTIVRNITKRKHDEMALRESEARYRLLAENIQDVITKMSPQMEITFITPSCYQQSGYMPEELMGRTGFEIVHPDDRAAAFQIVTEALQSGAPYFSLNERIQHKDGHFFWAESTNTIVRDPHTGEVVEFIGLFHDITKRKEVEDALRASEERFRLFVDAAPVATLVTDQNGAIVLVNREVEKLFGYDRDELIGHAIETLVPDAIKDIHLMHRATYMSHPERRRIGAMELEARRKDGKLFWADIQLSYIGSDQNPLVMCLVIDMTERKKAEEALRHALARERDLGELKSRFVSMTSHEFRTPLAAILAVTETLTHYRGRMDDAQIDARLGKIRHQVGHMKDIMEDVLQLARMETGRMPFNPAHGYLNLVCEEIIQELDSLPEYQNRIQCTGCDLSIFMHFDQRLMRQMIINLISNALKYSSTEQVVHVCLAQEQRQAVLTVIDEGIGIMADDLKYIFEPFHRGANVNTISGTGLGLSIAKQVVEIHGGTIHVESELGLGTTITVTIPIESGKSNEGSENLAH